MLHWHVRAVAWNVPPCYDCEMCGKCASLLCRRKAEEERNRIPPWWIF